MAGRENVTKLKEQAEALGYSRSAYVSKLISEVPTNPNDKTVTLCRSDVAWLIKHLEGLTSEIGIAVHQKIEFEGECISIEKRLERIQSALSRTKSHDEH